MGSVIVKQSSEIPGLENTILISSDALLSKSFIEATGAGTKGMFLSGPLLSIPEYDRLNTEYLSKFGSLPTATFPAHAYAYDATNILLNAIETVAIIDTNGTLHIGHQDLREAIAATTNFYGTSGIKTCNQYGDCDTGDSMVIFKITEAEIAGNWPPPIVWQQ
jgi:branched-chain amino acid transport system substrate-binding protein